MSRNKREEQLKKNEQYPLRSLTTEQRKALEEKQPVQKEKDE